MEITYRTKRAAMTDVNSFLRGLLNLGIVTDLCGETPMIRRNVNDSTTFPNRRARTTFTVEIPPSLKYYAVGWWGESGERLVRFR